ncbi:hypothetical protein B0A64_12470 [Flavobacterium araucananum]|uniref:Uncharacterized protein n=1 Tax=Flavobacterium araucananum TaxID=946678 RepID=A0A227P8D3_9FLAO|nr:hypothetical protein B0A64_12470 [Flavobacterium araucananum]
MGLLNTNITCFPGSKNLKSKIVTQKSVIILSVFSLLNIIARWMLLILTHRNIAFEPLKKGVSLI